MPLILSDGTEAAADQLRPLFASFIGAAGRNFHARAFDRMGLGGIAAKVGTLWSEGSYREAAAAIPTSVVEQLALIGPPGKIRDQLAACAQAVQCPDDGQAQRPGAAFLPLLSPLGGRQQLGSPETRRKPSAQPVIRPRTSRRRRAKRRGPRRAAPCRAR